MHPREKAIQAYKQQFGAEPQYIARAPGRVNLLGEHVDYNNGFVLPAAIDRETYLAFSPSGSAVNTIYAADFDEQCSYSSYSMRQKADVGGAPMKEWAYYPAGIAWVLEEAGHNVVGIQGAFCSNIPRGSGLSSSASVELVFTVAYQKVGGWQMSKMEMAKLGQKAENQFVGVNCGIMDQFASICGVRDNLLLLDCRSLQWSPVPFSEDLAIVVADTSVRRKLTSGEYNNRRDACEAAVLHLKHSLKGINSLRDVSPEDFARLSGSLNEEQRARAQHVVEEIARTERAVEQLKKGDFVGFGKAMEECHASLRDLYNVSSTELDLMTELAKDLPGYIGARLTGAGFGGCTVNLVKKGKAEEFARRLGDAYEAKSGLHPEIYVCHASDGASVEEG